MARKDPQINFRIPADLKIALEASAVENNRSLTAELVARLTRRTVIGDTVDKFEKLTFDMRYRMVCFSLQTLLYTVENAIATIPDEELSENKAFQMLKKTAEMIYIPPRLPANESFLKSSPLNEDLDKALDELKDALSSLESVRQPQS